MNRDEASLQNAENALTESQHSSDSSDGTRSRTTSGSTARTLSSSFTIDTDATSEMDQDNYRDRIWSFKLDKHMKEVRAPVPLRRSTRSSTRRSSGASIHHE